MKRDMQTSKQLVILYNYVRMLSNYVWHPHRLSEILECFIVSSVAKDCLVLSQYDLHHGSFLLVTLIVMSITAPSFSVKAVPFGGVLYSVSFVLM